MNKDTIFLIGLKLKTEDLYNYSLVNKKFKEIISSDIFWIKKYKYDFKKSIDYKKIYNNKKKKLQLKLSQFLYYEYQSGKNYDIIFNYLNKGATIDKNIIRRFILSGDLDILEDLYDKKYISLDLNFYLSDAIIDNNLPFVNMLLKKEVDLNYNNNQFLKNALFYDRIEIVNFLIKNGAIVTEEIKEIINNSQFKTEFVLD